MKMTSALFVSLKAGTRTPASLRRPRALATWPLPPRLSPGHRLQQNPNETGDAKRVQPPLPMHAGCAKRCHPKKPPPRLRWRWGFRATWYVRATRGVAPRSKLKPSALKELWNTIGSDNTPGQVHRFVKGPRTNLEGSSRVIGPTDELGR